MAENLGLTIVIVSRIKNIHFTSILNGLRDIDRLAMDDEVVDLSRPLLGKVVSDSINVQITSRHEIGVPSLLTRIEVGIGSNRDIVEQFGEVNIIGLDRSLVEGQSLGR